MYLQPSLLPEFINTNEGNLSRDTFSHEAECPETGRVELEERYGDLLEETELFSRKTVSFQANKTEILHSWVKYREGFSADLVEVLMRLFNLEPGDVVLDPFAGSSTTLLVAKLLGVDAVGIELLPYCHLAWEAKSRAFNYDLDELRYVLNLAKETVPPVSSEKFPHLTITETAFEAQTERDLMAYTHWVENLTVSENTKILCRLILVNILESISYTRKDGQYLRWDRRSKKVQEYNRRREEGGKKPIQGIHKGDLPSVKDAFIQTLKKIVRDVATLQKDPPAASRQNLVEGNTLYELPQMEADQFSGVITSPPYANRYDYTRTYALELAYLGVEEEIFNLRQRQLSCTVENKSKLDELREFYASIGAEDRYNSIIDVIQSNQVLAEVNAALKVRNELGEINNKGVLPMIDQYFTELTFVFAELYRTCKSGARVAFVNDNVRYAGEIIPVDTLSTDLAESVGFEPVKIYVLPQRKGNSSQQMGKYGRVALRKSITIWEKP